MSPRDRNAPGRARPTSARGRRPAAAGAAVTLIALAVLGGTPTSPARADVPAPDPRATPSPAAPDPSGEPRWAETPLVTEGDAHRVREGHVAPTSARDADAALAAGGTVVGASKAFEALARRHRANDPHHPHYRDGDVWIADVGLLLRGDRDADGFFGGFELTVDVDTEDGYREVYAVIELSDLDGTVSLRHASGSFSVHGHSVVDEYRIEVELLQNHPAGYRDLRVDIRDARDDRLLDEITPRGFPLLAALPLESEDGRFVDDVPYPDDPPPASGGAVGAAVGHEDAYVAGYAAANGPLGAIALLALAAARLARRLARAREERAESGSVR